MDPDKTLAQAVVLANCILLGKDLDESDAVLAEQGIMLAEFIESLDEWIAKGGAIPKRWQPLA